MTPESQQVARDVVADCIPQPGPTARDPWCGRCGHLLSDHPRVRETWAAEDEVRTLPTRRLGS